MVSAWRRVMRRRSGVARSPYSGKKSTIGWSMDRMAPEASAVPTRRTRRSWSPSAGRASSADRRSRARASRPTARRPRRSTPRTRAARRARRARRGCSSPGSGGSRPSVAPAGPGPFRHRGAPRWSSRRRRSEVSGSRWGAESDTEPDNATSHGAGATRPVHAARTRWAESAPAKRTTAYPIARKREEWHQEHRLPTPRPRWHPRSDLTMARRALATALGIALRERAPEHGSRGLGCHGGRVVDPVHRGPAGRRRRSHLRWAGDMQLITKENAYGAYDALRLHPRPQERGDRAGDAHPHGVERDGPGHHPEFAVRPGASS